MTKISAQYSRSEITGYKNHHQVSDLGVVQFKNSYDPELLSIILAKAKKIKDSHAEMRQLNLNYIRDASAHIPEIHELLYSPERMEMAEELAGVRLEPYPISVISSIITFTSPSPKDGCSESSC